MSLGMEDVFAVAGLAGRICVGLVFAIAAFEKMRYWSFLESVIGNYRLLPGFLVRPASWLLPPAELTVAILLLAGISLPLAVPAAMMLLLIFAVAMGLNIRRGRTHIDCGCHQSFLRQTLKPVLILRNLALAALLLPVAEGALPVNIAAGATGVAAGLAFFLFYLTVNTLTALDDSAGRSGIEAPL